MCGGRREIERGTVRTTNASGIRRVKSSVNSGDGTHTRKYDPKRVANVPSRLMILC